MWFGTLLGPEGSGCSPGGGRRVARGDLLRSFGVGVGGCAGVRGPGEPVRLLWGLGQAPGIARSARSLRTAQWTRASL